MRKTKIINSFSKVLHDNLDQQYMDFSLEQMIQTRVLLLAMGYEDTNDLSYLREDPVLQSLPSDKEYVILDVDCTDDPTHGNQQGSLFHGYYWQWMLNELFYIDGETGQVILPVL